MQSDAIGATRMGAPPDTGNARPAFILRGVLWAFALLLALALPIPGVAIVYAQEPGAEIQIPAGSSQSSDVARRAIGGLWSPYCPGLMLEVCTSQGGADMRDSIGVQARSGMPADAIVDFWVARFGEKYRAEPEFSGVGRFAWLTPYMALLAGVLVAAGVLARRRTRPTGGPVMEVTPADEERLSVALAELDRSEAPDF